VAVVDIAEQRMTLPNEAAGTDVAPSLRSVLRSRLTLGVGEMPFEARPSGRALPPTWRTVLRAMKRVEFE
jgi:hypothetical protein